MGGEALMVASMVAWLLSRWQREAAEAPEPGLAPEEAPAPVRVRPPLPAADLAEPGPAFTIAEECRLRALADQFTAAGDDARYEGEYLAGWLLRELPDMRGADIAKVLLAAGGALASAANSQDDERAALTVIGDALQGAPAVLAGLELALTEGHGW
jgi:hypothetical protein